MRHRQNRIPHLLMLLTTYYFNLGLIATFNSSTKKDTDHNEEDTPRQPFRLSYAHALQFATCFFLIRNTFGDLALPLQQFQERANARVATQVALLAASQMKSRARVQGLLLCTLGLCTCTCLQSSAPDIFSHSARFVTLLRVTCFSSCCSASPFW